MSKGPQIKSSFSQKKGDISDEIAKKNQRQNSDFFQQADPSFRVERLVEPKPININSPLKSKQEMDQKRRLIDLPVPPLGGGLDLESNNSNQEPDANFSPKSVTPQAKANKPQNPPRQTGAPPQSAQADSGKEQKNPTSHTNNQNQNTGQPVDTFSQNIKNSPYQEKQESKENKDHLLGEQQEFNPEFIEKQNSRLKGIIKFLVAFFVVLLIIFGFYYIYVFYSDMLVCL